jgi:hypothetical protein
MKFIGQKRIVKVDENYIQIKTLTKFWDEMRKAYPNEAMLGLGTNWVEDRFDYYIGKVNEQWDGGSDSVIIPDEGWEEFVCELDDDEIEKMYRRIYEKGSLDYEIELIEDDKYTAKVHFKDKKEK